MRKILGIIVALIVLAILVYFMGGYIAYKYDVTLKQGILQALLGIVVTVVILGGTFLAVVLMEDD